MPWVYDPHAGGVKIPERTKYRTKQRILAYAQQHYAGTYTRLGVRFRGVFCYLDAYVEPSISDDFPPPGFPETKEAYLERLRNTPVHLCRLRHFTEDRWSVAFYSYASERYEPCILPNGTFEGTPEEGFEVGAVYLQESW